MKLHTQIPGRYSIEGTETIVCPDRHEGCGESVPGTTPLPINVTRYFNIHTSIGVLQHTISSIDIGVIEIPWMVFSLGAPPSSSIQRQLTGNITLFNPSAVK